MLKLCQLRLADVSQWENISKEGRGPPMDLVKVLAELRQEQQQIDEAITTLERLAIARGGSRRGRKPAWMKGSPGSTKPDTIQAAAPKRRGRPAGSKNKPAAVNGVAASATLVAEAQQPAVQ